jgi:hypothetical protein
MSRYKVKLTDGMVFGLEIVGNVSASREIRQAQMQAIVDQIFGWKGKKARKIKDWEMPDTEEDWDNLTVHCFGKSNT